MNLADMLSYADIHELSKIANNYECECSSHSKHELIQSILLTMGRKDVFQKEIEHLSLEDLRFLNSLLFDHRSSYSLEELISRARQTRFIKEDEDEWNPRDTISKFKRRGWLFNGYTLENKFLFQMPGDLKRRFSEVIGTRFKTQIQTTNEPPIYRDEHMLMADDLLIFLKELARQNFPLTNDQYLYKRQLQQILELMNVEEIIPQREPWRFGYGRKYREYPSRFSLIYDYSYYNGLIIENNNELQLSDKGLSFITEGKKSPLPDLYKTWVRIYKNAVSNLQSLIHWVDELATQWVTYTSLEGVLVPLIKPYYYDIAETILDRRVMHMMMHLGLLRVGEDEKWGKVVQMTALGNSIIRGNFVSEEDTIRLPQEGSAPV